MGVPKFFRWISERYPCLSELVKDYQIPDFDNLYLDMNGIIHMCSHPNDFDPHFRISEEKIFRDIFHYIEFLFRMIKPQKVFFMAVDGVAPRAKMNQQRGRRFRSAKEAEVLEKKARELGETLPSEERFDSNCITPGTEFMHRLHEQLKYFVTYKVSTDKLWKKVKVILSGQETPGEGEHKIMDYIRYLKSQPEYDPNTRHCLYGLDADLIMLGLCTHEPHFSLLREEVKYNVKKNQKRRIPTPEETKFFLLHLSLMREYLDWEFQCLKSVVPFTYDMEKIIDDWVLMGFLVGNDFIPHLPAMHISSGALPILYKAYKDVLPTLDGYINEGGTLNLPRFEKYMKKLAQFDINTFRDYYTDLKYFEGKTGRKLGAKERPRISSNPQDFLDAIESHDQSTDSSEKFTSKNPDLEELIKSSNELFGEQSSESDDLSSDDEDDESENEATMFMEFYQHKRNYYQDKLEYKDVTEEVLRSQAEGYVRAIQWNLHYYYNGVCSWSWFYPHHYAPYISDIKEFANLKLEFDMGKPFHPFEQLLAVLPAASKKLLPKSYQDLMVNQESPILSYYPTDFKTDLNGKKQDWEAVVLIPFIDEDCLLSAMEPLNNQLSEDEQKRNSHGPMLIYTYTEEDLGTYEAPEHFPVVEHNHAKAQPVTRDDIYVDPQDLVKGLCPDVKLDVYFPGFPTLKHIPHDASLCKAKVKVFEMASRGESMILNIRNQGKPDIKEVAQELLGKSIYVAWPHMYEAKVVAVANKELKYNYNEKKTENDCQPVISIEEVKGDLQSKLILQRKSIQDHYMERLGVNIGETTIIVFAVAMTGRKYTFGVSSKITLEKQWSNVPTAYALQTTVKDIAVYVPSFVQYRSVQELFAPKSMCFMLGHPHYGCLGEVVEGPIKNGRVKISVSSVKEPNLEGVKRKQHEYRTHYMPGNIAAQKLGITSHLLSRLTGSIYLSNNDLNESSLKLNVGLNLKFNKKNEEIPGYTRKEFGVWYYSQKAVELVRDYMQNFPEVIEYIGRHTGNDVFFESDVFPIDEERPDKLTKVKEWLKNQEYTKIEKQTCGAEILEAEVIREMEKELDVFQETNITLKTVIMQVKPHLLYKNELHIGHLPPDPNTETRLFDRVVNVKEDYAVPCGLKGTVIGVQRAPKQEDVLYDILFDKPFPGGLALNCSPNRGYRVHGSSFINISHGVRHELLKNLSKPTAIVQPSENSVLQDTPFPPENNRWTDNYYAPKHRPNSAFASWNGANQMHMVPPFFTNKPLAPLQPSYMHNPKQMKMPLGGTQAMERLQPFSQSMQPHSLLGEFPHPDYQSPPPPFQRRGNVQNFGGQLNSPDNFNKNQRMFFNSDDRRRGGPRGQDHKAVQQQVRGKLRHQEGSPKAESQEFQAMWNELKKSNSAGPSSGASIKAGFAKENKVPAKAEAPDSGTEMLKQLLKIPAGPAQPENSQASSSSAPGKQVSVEQLFERARAAGSREASDISKSYCADLMTHLQNTGFGMPRYNYIHLNEDQMVKAQVVLPDRRAFYGEPEKSKDKAAENAAKVALSEIKEKPIQLSGSSMAANTLPTPPQQWYQHQQPWRSGGNQGYQNRYHGQQPGYQQQKKADNVMDWRRACAQECYSSYDNASRQSSYKHHNQSPNQGRPRDSQPMKIWHSQSHKQNLHNSPQEHQGLQFVPLQVQRKTPQKESSGTDGGAGVAGAGTPQASVASAIVSSSRVQESNKSVKKDQAKSPAASTSSEAQVAGQPVIEKKRKSRLAINFQNMSVNE